ncbi:MAG TPA: N-acetyltransferase DgcN [Stellaceae bacterium]|nr:N-acetyltransferase DgcN [Stellaceae bacterium]
MAMLKTPYLLFLGDAHDALAAKTAAGVAYWRPESCVGQLRLPGCKADLKLPDKTVEAAAKEGAKTLVVGVANRGGVINENWIPVLVQALESGMDLASGLHRRLTEVPALKAAAERHGREIHDVRHPTREFEVANGKPRSGKRLLTVGTDCSIGKMFTSLALEREMRRRKMKADFRATGQTGILIAGDGISVDAVVADFISGSVEWLAPANEPDHWDLIEGQGSLFHASYAGVSMGLLHGAQPTALVMCHEPTRTHMRGLPHYPLPPLKTCIEVNLQAARLTSPEVAMVGIAINTSALDGAAAEKLLKQTADQFGLPCVDPVRTGVGPIVDRIA